MKFFYLIFLALSVSGLYGQSAGDRILSQSSDRIVRTGSASYQNTQQYLTLTVLNSNLSDKIVPYNSGIASIPIEILPNDTPMSESLVTNFVNGVFNLSTSYQIGAFEISANLSNILDISANAIEPDAFNRIFGDVGLIYTPGVPRSVWLGIACQF
ncbi:MAG: hypothetical protein WCH46_00625 [bacterium]